MEKKNIKNQNKKMVKKEKEYLKLTFNFIFTYIF